MPSAGIKALPTQKAPATMWTTRRTARMIGMEISSLGEKLAALRTGPTRTASGNAYLRRASAKRTPSPGLPERPGLPPAGAALPAARALRRPARRGWWSSIARSGPAIRPRDQAENQPDARSAYSPARGCGWGGSVLDCQQVRLRKSPGYANERSLPSRTWQGFNRRLPKSGTPTRFECTQIIWVCLKLVEAATQ